MKILKKEIFDCIYKNRFLIINCIVLIFGTLFGMSMLKIVPEEIQKNLFTYISNSSPEFINILINRFSFPFLVLIGIYLSGTSIFGSITAPLIVFINGFFFGFENAVKYRFTGMDYIINSLIVFFTSAVFINFILIIMAENSIFYSRQLLSCVTNNNLEKPHYNAKKLSVKFITFTAFFAFVSTISAYFSRFIQSVL